MKKLIALVVCAVVAVCSVLAACKTVNKITAIAVTVPPEKTEFYVGEKIELKGAKITVKYEDDTEKVLDVSDDMLTTAELNKTPGEKNVVISYSENDVIKTTTVKIKIIPKTASEEHVRAEMASGDESDVLTASALFDNSALPYGCWKKVEFRIYSNGASVEAVSEGENLDRLLDSAAENWQNKSGWLRLDCDFGKENSAENKEIWEFSTENIDLVTDMPDKLTVSIETADTIYSASYTVPIVIPAYAKTF